MFHMQVVDEVYDSAAASAMGANKRELPYPLPEGEAAPITD